MTLTHDVAGGRLSSLPARLALGIVGGFLAGIPFIAVTSWLNAMSGKPADAPFMLISTIALGPAAIKMGTASVILGETIHSLLAAVFGLILAVLTHPVRGHNALIAATGLVYGGFVYAVDFQIFARFVHQFSALSMANQPFELVTHLFFGALAALFLMQWTRRRAGIRASEQHRLAEHTGV